MFRILSFGIAVLGMGLLASPVGSQEKDVKWSFDIEQRVGALEKRVSGIEKVLAAPAVSPGPAFATPPRPMERPVTPKMASMGFGWSDINSLVNHLANLLERDGMAAASVVRNGLKLIQAVTDRDVSGFISALMSERVDIVQLVADIRKEFGLVGSPVRTSWTPTTAFSDACGSMGYAAPAVVTSYGAYGAGSCSSGVSGSTGEAVGRTGPVRAIFQRFRDRPRLFGGRVGGGC